MPPPLAHDTNPDDLSPINVKARRVLPALLKRWLPDGKLRGRHWVARNPRRDDRSAGSFKVNVQTGQWKDWATGDGGPDVVSLAAYLAETSEAEAARRLSEMLELC